MALVLTVAGVEQQFKNGSLSLSHTANGHTTASFTFVDSESPFYRPDLDAEVIIEEDGDRIFGGLIDRPSERGFENTEVEYLEVETSAVDFNAYTDRRFVKATVPSGNLKAALIVVLAYLADYGVTLDPDQVDGPTLPDLDYDYRALTDVLNEFVTLTGTGGAEPYVWSIDAFKVLRMVQPSTMAAPFDVLPTGPSYVVGDIAVETTRDDYANRVIVKVPKKTEVNRKETFTGDGSADSFTLQYTPFNFYGYVTDDADAVPPVNLTLNVTGDTEPASWTYDAATNTITRNDGAPALGQSIAITFDGTFEGVGIAFDAGEITAHGIWEKVVQVEDVPSDTTIQALADAYLAQSLPVTKTVKYTTHTAGLMPGMTQTITVPNRDLDDTVIITEVVTRDWEQSYLIREITAVVNVQTNLGGRNWRQVYQLWAGDKTGGDVGVALGDAGISSGGAAPPDKSVQHNKAGAFGGKVEFTFDYLTNCLVCGLETDITATSAESCQAFGVNCHIVDP